jgi:hypothetical protein
MIFCESFIPPQDRRNPGFDRRDVYLITQNALADNTYLDYIRAHYNRSAQEDPPFFYSALNDAVSISRGRTNFSASLMAPIDRWMTAMGDSIEKERRAGSSYFQTDDLKDAAALKARISAGADPFSAYLKEKLGSAGNGDTAVLIQALNRFIEGPSCFEPTRFAAVKLSDHVARFAAQNPTGHNRIRLNRLLIEETYPGLIKPSLGGLYPDREIQTPTPEDLRRCFEEYSIDAQRRAQSRQLKPGEVLTQLPDGRVSVSGQTAVMSINGLLTKVIFDKNPDHSFYVEESFALDWMYPHLVPYGIILKIEREPVAQLTDDQIERDHEYWSQYSERFIGNWITYETPVKEVCEFAVRTYRLRDYSVFKGDARFVRDDNAQKAFSKLRNAIGKSVYGWRAQEARDPAYQAKLIKEAEFAMKQAFAFCPYSPETVFNYASLLAGLGRYPDAYRVVATCYEIDPDNAGIRDLLKQLEPYKDSPIPAAGVGTPSQPAAAAVAAAEEVVVAHLVEGRERRERGDVAAHVGVLAGAQHHHHRVPADHRVEPALDAEVARVGRLAFHGNGVGVGGPHAAMQVAMAGRVQLGQLVHQVVRARAAGGVDDRLQRLTPFLGFLRVGIEGGERWVHVHLRGRLPGRAQDATAAGAAQRGSGVAQAAEPGEQATWRLRDRHDKQAPAGRVDRMGLALYKEILSNGAREWRPA